jgi:hypothetical protein
MSWFSLTNVTIVGFELASMAGEEAAQQLFAVFRVGAFSAVVMVVVVVILTAAASRDH